MLKKTSQTPAFDNESYISSFQWNVEMTISVISNSKQTTTTDDVFRKSKSPVCSLLIPKSIKNYKYKNGFDLFNGLMSAYYIPLKGKVVLIFICQHHCQDDYCFLERI
ncbi:hypothetical protein NPIL_203621 [Nephila pilipes]|uniref:Uncharacterized protein n=1 Tax=Nephila pilipes TaxID=299642 RepID=A0A8X6QHV6_NEPPI|nr:hypothetical protein NPIL_249111 [Nephila pilipes]GFT11034.1 hypothetical protein NPIL_182991 [Nephila pilipes]GFT30004.1 hypothetical protein NPIL_345751 [Nephila pilipes]GFT44008.1 hypothetical protein NPIL_485501 [Nephila pilipes]GFU12115.1 hypothetical protein NPIL_200361 [Nephila pilipes]